jgi:hypothetical protein
MFKTIFNGRGGRDLRELPAHIAEVDHLVCCAPPDIRIVLIKFYGTGGSYYEKAQALGIDKRTLKRRIDRADYYAHSILDAIPQQSVYQTHDGHISPPAHIPKGTAARFLRHITQET